MSQKVLVVEDDINIAELLRLYLQKDGFEVSHAADGGKAVEVARQTGLYHKGRIDQMAARCSRL